MLDEEICVFFLIGHCSNKHQCKDSHKVKNCPYKGCNPQMCHLRHPPVCKMWSFNVCPYETTCNHLHFFPQSPNTQLVENETILFNLTSLNDKEENVDRTKDLIQKLTKEKEENEKELTMKLGTANANIKDLHKNISKLEDERKYLKEKAEEQEENLQKMTKERKYLEETLINKDKEIREIVESSQKERVCQAEVHEELTKKINGLKKEKSEKEETLTKEFEKVQEELNLQELERVIVTQRETAHKEVAEQIEKCADNFLALIRKYASYLFDYLDFLEEIGYTGSGKFL